MRRAHLKKIGDWIAKRLGMAPSPAAAGRDDSAERLYRLGEAACEAGRPEQAIDLLARAIALNGGEARYHYKLGVALHGAGALERALESYGQAIALDPGFAPAHNNRGAILHARGELSAAIESYARALALRPGLVEAARNLGIAWLEAGDSARAEQFSRLAMQLEPDAALPRVHLARILRTAGRFDEALELCRQAVALEPDSAAARFELGRASKELGRWEESVTALRRAIALAPRTIEAAEAWLSLGLIHDLTGGTGGLELSRKALAMQPDSALVHYNFALHLLLAGAFAQGWREYEWRWRLPDAVAPVSRAEQPHWDGSPVAGREILLYAEQGYGDAIHFVRYAELVAQRGARVTVCCAPKLQAVFAGAPGVSAVVDDREQLPAAHLYCSLLSLPGIFGTTLDTVPARVPYLFADPRRKARWSARVAGRDARLKVGLCWATDSPSRTAAMRSLSLEALAPLAGIPGLEFYSLQRGAAAAHAARPPQGMTLIDPSAELHDFADDAALISCLDLVISIDTATAHLAGALGKPVWTMTSFPPDWRWLLDREDSPWYPTMRLFRQRRMHDWSEVTRRVADALAKLLA